MTKTKRLILIAMMAAIGISIKPFVAPIANLITDPIHVTGGSTAGGIYMAILVISGLIIEGNYNCTKVGLIEGILALSLGITGFQGPWAILVYSLPGLVADIVLKLKLDIKDRIILSCILANLTGSIITNTIFHHLPFLPFILMILLGILSGWFGGKITIYLYERLKISLKGEIQ